MTSVASSVTPRQSAPLTPMRRMQLMKRRQQQIQQQQQKLSSIMSVPLEKKLVYSSPRIENEDETIFPKKNLHASEARWKSISQQAGQHRQDGAVLTLSRGMAPLALKAGVTPAVASRVRRLNLDLDPREDILPEWMDIISSLFFDLEHITVNSGAEPSEEETVSARMRRLYVLYRFPDLISIDDIAVNEDERRLARPNDPNGQRVERQEWVPKDSLLDGVDDEDDVQSDSGDGNDDVDDDGQLSALDGSDIIESHSDPGRAITSYTVPQQTPRNQGVELTTAAIEGMRTLHMSASYDHSTPNRSTMKRSASTSTSPGTGKGAHRHFFLEKKIHGDALEVDLKGSVNARRLETPRAVPLLDLQEHKSDRSNHNDHDSSQRQAMDSPRTIQQTDTLDFVSVTSDCHDYSPLCGISFARLGCSPSRLACRPRLKKVGEKKTVKVESPSRVKTKPPSPIYQPDKTKQGRNMFGHFVGRHNSMPRTPTRPGNAGGNGSSAISDNKKLSPSKSLTSPFPMQFRDRVASATNVPGRQRENDSSLGPLKLQDSPTAPGRENTAPRMETISTPIPLARIASSPSRIVVSPRSYSKPGDLPPRGNSSRRKTVTAAMTKAGPLRSRKAKRMFRQRKNARSTSVMDWDDDDNSDFEDDDDDMSSDEEDISVVIEEGEEKIEEA